MIMNDAWIKEMCEGDMPLITPFVSKQVQKGKVSYGVGGFGYDLRLGSVFKLMKSSERPLVFDPTSPLGEDYYLKIDTGMDEDPIFDMQPFSDVLAITFESVNMPNDIMGIVKGKSTYARGGLIVNVTPIDPGYSGYITMSLINPTNRIIRLRPNQGIAQMMFLKGDKVLESYADKSGKYLNSRDVEVAKVK